MREQARRDVIAVVGTVDRRIAKAWAPIFRRLSRAIQSARPEDVAAIIDQTMRELAAASLPHATEAVRTGVSIGIDAAQRQDRELTSPAGPMPATPGYVPPRPADARVIAEAQLSGQHVRDGISLSQRLYRGADEVGRSATPIVRSSIEARDGVFQGAEQFLAANREAMNVPVPQYVEDLYRAARASLDTGDRSILEDTIRAHARQMERLGEGRTPREGLTTLRSTVRQFVHDLRRASPEQLDKVLARHIEDRAQFLARRILRTETAEAHRRAFRAVTDESPYTQGYRWKLSSAHPRADVCDALANQNLHDLGPGGYPKDQVPDTPHPQCLCTHEAILDEHYFRRQIAEQTGAEAPPTPWIDTNRQTAEEWLTRQPERFQRELLGPTRTAIFRDPRDPRRVIDARGVPIPISRIVAAP